MLRIESLEVFGLVLSCVPVQLDPFTRLQRTVPPFLSSQEIDRLFQKERTIIIDISGESAIE
jgi:hypothetical protein